MNRRLLRALCLPLLLTPLPLTAAVDETRARQAGEAAVQSVIPRKMDYGKLKLGLMPFRATVSRLTISENERFARHPLRDWPYFYTAREVDLTAELLPLLIGRINVNRLDVRDFQANLLVDKDFSLNTGDLMQQKRGRLMSWLRVKEFHASGGSVRVVDASAARGPARLVFDDIDARFTGFALKDRFNLDIGLRTPGATARNVSLRGVAGPILDTVRSEQVPLDGTLTVTGAPILPFSPYIPDGLTAYPESGLASLKLALRGNAWEGMTSQGVIRIDQLVLAARDGKLRGKPFSLTLDIGRNVVRMKEEKVEVNDMSVTLGGNRLTLDGVVTGIPRHPAVDMGIRNPAVDLAAMEEIYPFFRAYLPKGLAFRGTAALDIRARGDMQAMTANGRLDVTRLGLFLPEVFEKREGAALNVAFRAGLSPSAFTIRADADVSGGNLTLLNAWLFRDGLRLALDNALSGRQLETVMHAGNTLNATSIQGAMAYRNGFVSFSGFRADGLADSEGPVLDTRITGSFDLDRLRVRWEVEAWLSAERSRRLLKLAPALTARLDADGRLPFRFRVDGPMEHPVVLAVRATPGQLLASR